MIGRMKRSPPAPAVFALIAGVSLALQGEPARADSTAVINETQATLRNLPLDRLSSGALMRLDRGGDLVQWPVATPGAAKSSRRSSDPTLNAGLDPRIGPNLQLGNDPSQLPLGFRAQAEPHIARDPNDVDLLAATFQEGRYTDGGAVDCGYSISHDGGLTWSRALIPSLTQASGGVFYRATDPVVGIGPQGHVYLNTLASVDAAFNLGAVLVSRSTNRGASFEPPVEVYRPASTSLFADKNWMAVNTFPQTPTAGRIVVTWTLFTSNPIPLARSYSDDGGKTWSDVAYVTPSSYYCQGSQPVYLPDGTLAVVYWNFASSLAAGEAIELVTSTDGGSTFRTPLLVTPVVRYTTPGIRQGSFLPSATADRTNGVLFVTYQAFYQGAPRILFTKSSDKGAHWTTPKAASDNPASAPVFNPAITVSPDGQVVTIVFHDQRVNLGQTNLVDLFLAQSFDGGTTWQPNLRLSTVSSDVRLAPLTSSGYMLGDYLGIAPPITPDVPAVPVWVDTRTGNPDPFIARVGIAPQVTFTSWRAARFSQAQIADPSIAGPGGNPDGDAFVNVLEYALGLRPWIEDELAFGLGLSRSTPTATFSASYERVSTPTDLKYYWFASTNLSGWNELLPTSETVLTNASRMTETVTSSFAATNASQFYRLSVTLE